MGGTCCNMRLAFGGLLCLSLLIAISVASEECDKSKCKGPLSYYKDLKCKPIYKNPGDCCATAYDCSRLLDRSPDKCYVNDNVYELGEGLRDEDRASPCNIGCTCLKDYTGVGAAFVCAVVDCFNQGAKPGCYLRQNVDSCCPGEEICPEKPEDRFKCEVDGKIYRDSEWFSPKENPDLVCICMEGYKGENVKPFCTVSNYTCGLELHGMPQIHKNCAPVYYNSQSPSKDCNVFYRCQNSNDTIIPSQDSPKTDVKVSEDMMCKFGNMSMHVGDELNQATDYSSVCVKCVCDVPPTLTCQRLPDEECDVTVHPNF